MHTEGALSALAINKVKSIKLKNHICIETNVHVKKANRSTLVDLLITYRFQLSKSGVTVVLSY